jgi:SAM-dependent methyltransferase
VREADYLLALRGLAALRTAARRDEALAAEHLARLRRTACAEPPDSGQPRVLPAMRPDEGYAEWAASYDLLQNATIALEEPAVTGLLASVPPGRALDVGCGTGRHTARLAAAGHDVVGIDPTPEMLAVARERLPGVELRLGGFDGLPARDGDADLVVCALALSHVPSLGAPVAELARVLAPGGLLVISNPHPFATAVLGWRACFVRRDGSRAAIPEYAHMAQDYVAALAGAGLRIEACLEPLLPPASDEDAEDAALVEGLPAVIVWAARCPGPG